jgi:hypothetical protein
MSVQFTSNTHVCGIDSNTAISHRAFTMTAKAYLDSDTAGAAISLETTSSQYHELYWAGSATGWRVGVNYRNATNSRTIGTSATGVWVSVALVGQVNGSDGSELRGIIKPPGGALVGVTAPNPQYNDTLDNIHISAADTTLGSWFRGKIADVKIWSRALSDAEVDAEFASQAAASTANLICANYFDGGSISAALTSDVSNAAYANTWSNLDYAGVARSNPVYSADAPTYGSVAPTLSGAWTMPDTMPAAPGIGTVQSALATVEAGSAVSATLATAPTVDNLLVVKVSGFMQTATAITVTDNQRAGSPLGPNVYTQRILQQGSGSGAQMWAGIWTLRVPTDAVAPFTVTATPNAASNWISISVEEVDEVSAVSPIIGTPTGANGSSNAPAVNLASVASAPALITAVATSLSSVNTWIAVANWTAVRTREGTGALASIERRVATTGDYDPTWSLSAADSWAAAAIVLAESGGLVAPTITTTTLPNGTAGQAYPTQTLAATGSQPITWSVSAGSLPSGLGLNASLGTISGTLASNATSQSFTVRADNAAGNDTQALTITIGEAPAITTTTLASGVVGTAYHQPLIATGAQPIAWTQTGTLAPGLSLLAGAARNKIRNPAGIGYTNGVVGSGGAAPTNWVLDEQSSAGPQVTVTGGQTIGALQAVQIRLNGTPLRDYWAMLADLGSVAVSPASPGQAWSYQVTVAPVSGTIPTLTWSLYIQEFDSSNGFVRNVAASYSGVLAATQLISGSVTTGANTVYVRTILSLEGIQSASPVGARDFTFKVGGWQLEQAAAPTAFVDPRYAYVTGTPTAAGSYQITASATNSFGAASRPLTIAVGAAPVVAKRSSPWAKWLSK